MRRVELNDHCFGIDRLCWLRFPRTRRPCRRSMSSTVHASDSLLRHPAFVLFWSARVCAAIAFQMVGVALGWQMYALTGSALDLGLVGLSQFLPATVLILIIGQLAD